MARITKKRKPEAPPASPLAALMEKHLEALRVLNYSEYTVKNRRVHLGFFLAWCHDRGITEPTEVTRPILEHYQRYLFHYRQKNGNPLSFRSQHTRLVPIRVWFRWLARQHHILHNPASELELPRLEHRLPKSVLSVGEIEQVLAQPDIRDPLGLRDRALMETLYSTGMRRRELANLKVYDLDTERGTVTIRQGKGKKDRMIPIGERAAAWMEKYIREARPKLVVEPDDHTVFLSNAGEPFCLDHLSDLVREHVDAANIGKRGACHMIRHTMATLMLDNGADTRYIQEMLGHADLKTTQIYTQVSIRQLKRIHAATHPGASLEKKSPAPAADNPGDEDALHSAPNQGHKDDGDE
ncbi:MAG: site-specific tyrosine recombinase XerC [Acidobacteriia bacterium]|nr:site-specific tyrosine recombinase XerC [Terriglobia bacterium]